EAQAERIGDADDLEDVVCGEACIAGADRPLGDPDARGDAAERLAAVLLQRLDQPPVELVDLPLGADWAAAIGAGGGVGDDRAAQSEGIPTRRRAFRQRSCILVTNRGSSPGHRRLPEEGPYGAHAA